MLVIIDIDQTISDGAARAAAAGPEPDREADPTAYKNWKNTINEGLELDSPVPAMREFSLLHRKDAVYVTARGEDLYDKTQKWLWENGFPILPLYMRPADDMHRSAQFKESVILELLIKRRGPVLVVDDDELDELRKVCSRRGWMFLKAYPPNQTEEEKTVNTVSEGVN